MYSAPQQCPTCGHGIEIREVSCPHCETTVRGRWSPGPFDRLSADQQTFLALFVRSRGNLSEVERTLGVSYPTVRTKLEEVISVIEEASEQITPAVSAQTTQTPPAEQASSAAASTEETQVAERDEILAMIARGDLSVDEGMTRLQQISGENKE